MAAPFSRRGHGPHRYYFRLYAAEVASLLEHAGRLGDFLEQPALGPDFTLLPAT